MDDSEGAHRWMQVFDELRARGVEDVLYVSSDGVAGLGEGLASVFPRAVRRRCVVHLVRNSLSVFVKTVVSWVARKTFRPGTASFHVRQGMPLSAFS